MLIFNIMATQMQPKNLIPFLLWAITAVGLFAQGVGINETGASPSSSAILDVSSTSRGFLPPRMTTAQRNQILNPSIGLTVFNTDLNCLEVCRSTALGFEWSCSSGFGENTLFLQHSTNVGQSYVTMGFCSVKAGFPVKISGYKRTTGTGSIAVLLEKRDNQGNWVSADPIHFTLVSTIDGSSSTTIGGNTGYSGVPMTFEGVWIPAQDTDLRIRTKELTSGSTGTGVSGVILMQ